MSWWFIQFGVGITDSIWPSDALSNQGLPIQALDLKSLQLLARQLLYSICQYMILYVLCLIYIYPKRAVTEAIMIDCLSSYFISISETYAKLFLKCEENYKHIFELLEHIYLHSSIKCYWIIFVYWQHIQAAGQSQGVVGIAPIYLWWKRRALGALELANTVVHSGN